MCNYPLKKRKTFVRPDITKDRIFLLTPGMIQSGFQFYAGAPLITHDGLALGTLWYSS